MCNLFTDTIALTIDIIEIIKATLIKLNNFLN